MVMMDFPAASLTESWHERRGVPLRSMVQAPHCPSPQPYFVPVRPSSSRSAKSKVVSGSERNSRLFPFIWAWIGPAIWSSKCGTRSVSIFRYQFALQRKRRQEQPSFDGGPISVDEFLEVGRVC